MRSESASRIGAAAVASILSLQAKKVECTYKATSVQVRLRLEAAAGTAGNDDGGPSVMLMTTSGDAAVK